MKFKLLAFLFLAISTMGNAQEYKNELRKEFNNYLSTIVNREFEKSMEYMLPEFFEIIPKSEMIKMLKMTFNNPSLEYQFKNSKILNVHDKEEIESKHYALLAYCTQINLKVKSEDEETTDEKTARINLTKLLLEDTFGSGNVNYNQATDFFEIQSEKKVYGVSENGENHWKFIVIEKDQKAILESLLPHKLIEKL